MAISNRARMAAAGTARKKRRSPTPSRLAARIPASRRRSPSTSDLFVVRVAGNVATDEAIGSIEYALDHLKTPKLILVLGHERCGAVEAALALKPTHDLVPSILNRIFPAIEGIPPNIPEESRLTDAVERNVRYTIRLLPAYSAVIRHAVTDLHVAIQGAYYSVSSGKVTKVSP
jgi:carbonic anhydrase